MIPVNKFSSRSGARVRLVTIHDSEGSRTVDSLAAYLRQPSVEASYHGAFDDSRYEAYVNYNYAAWHLRNGNPIADGGCLCGFAKWTREEWLQHPRMLDLASAWIAERCTARRVPIRWLTVQETADAIRNPNHPGGVIMHRDYTLATKLLGRQDGTHTDCGDGLPKDVIIAKAQQLAGITTGTLSWPDWMPRGHFFGLIGGGVDSHGGFYDREKPYVRLIQQRLIAKGYVPGITDPVSSWADGVFEQPTADAVERFQRAEMPGTILYGEVWADDWARLMA